MTRRGSLCLGVAASQASDWPQWGGRSSRNMYSTEKGLPDRFEIGKINPDTGEVDLKGSKNVKWVAKLGSQSYGNCTVAAGKVFGHLLQPYLNVEYGQKKIDEIKNYIVKYEIRIVQSWTLVDQTAPAFFP